MKLIILKLIKLSPLLIVLLIAAYVLEELLEDFVSETVSDFVYPVAGLIVVGILWKFLLPTVEAYLTSEEK